MEFIAIGTFILGCVVGWWLRQVTLIQLEIMFDDGTSVDGYLKRGDVDKVNE